MNLTTAQFDCVRSQGLHTTAKCDACRKLLNQTFRYTIAGKPEVYCSAGCRDLTFFGDTRQAKKRSAPGICVFCGGTLEGKRSGALHCEEICKKRAARTGRDQSTAEPQITGTPTQSNQRIANPRTGGQGNRIACGPQPLRNARDGASNPAAAR